MAGRCMDGHTLILRLLPVGPLYSSEELVIEAVGEMYRQRILVGQLLGNVTRVGPRRVGIGGQAVEVLGCAASGSGEQ
jgi:hypothetical protein